MRKRLDNYTETLRKRNRQPIRDVRDVFTEVGNPNMYTPQHMYTNITHTKTCL